MSSPPQSQLVPEPFCIISTNASEENPNKLFLGGIPPQATEKQLEEFFSQFGVVRDVRIVTDRVTAECKGYGFVTFDQNEDIEHLVERKTIRMSGKKIRIRKAIRRNGSQFDHIHSSKVTTDKTISKNVLNQNEINVLPLKEEQSPPRIIPVENYPIKPVYVPVPPTASSEPIYEYQAVWSYSPNQVVVSSPPEFEYHDHQCRLQSLNANQSWIQPEFNVIYVPNFSHSNQNQSWLQY